MIEKTLRSLADDATGRLPKNMSLINPLRLKPYIEKVLPLELACASSDRDEPLRLPEEDKKDGVLVMLVGHSLDPLLQTVCAYNPTRILLILNKEYHKSGMDWGDEVAGWIEKLWELLPEARKKLPEAAKPYVEQLLDGLLAAPLRREYGTIEKIVLDKGDHPAAVYHKLREELKPFIEAKEKIVLDITGGKKSMVTGAFLFGARTKVPISYVDFDEYDHETRAPRGYTCRIGTLRNPYTLFRLLEWERVRGFYEKYAFRNAGQLLGEIRQTMEALKNEGGWFSEKDLVAAETLIEVMKIYERWENGDFRKAHADYEELKEDGRIDLKLFPMPTSVHMLGAGDYWPHNDKAGDLYNQVCELEFKFEKTDSDADEEKVRSLYLEMPRLLTYVHDELAKIERLIKHNEDYRSALLRAVGLTEVLLRARMFVLLESKKAEVAVEPTEGQEPDYKPWGESDSVIDDWKVNIYERIARMESVYPLIPALRYQGKKEKCAVIFCKKGEKQSQAFRLRRSLDEKKTLLDKSILWDEGKNLRNKATHFCLSVQKEIADEAKRKASENARDFEECWATLVHPERTRVCTETMEWKKLLKACRVDFLPPTIEEDDDEQMVVSG